MVAKNLSMIVNNGSAITTNQDVTLISNIMTKIYKNIGSADLILVSN